MKDLRFFHSERVVFFLPRKFYISHTWWRNCLSHTDFLYERYTNFMKSNVRKLYSSENECLKCFIKSERFQNFISERGGSLETQWCITSPNFKRLYSLTEQLFKIIMVKNLQKLKTSSIHHTFILKTFWGV